MMSPTRLLRSPLFLLLSSAPLLMAASPDLTIADFEGDSFGDWKVSGDAFGKAPARGALPGQMPVDGFRDRGLANGFHGGDDAEGSLVSPEFKIERKFINFLIGGGKFPGETCIELKVDGKTVRSAMGRNEHPGGSERLEWESWDVSDLAGKNATLHIIDKRKGTWGHLTVDHLVQSDAPATVAIDKEFVVNQRYLIWPVSKGNGERRRFFGTLDGEDKPLFYSDIALSNNPDFWVFTDLANYQGRRIKITGKIPGNLAAAWEKVAISATYPGEEELYKEPLRPQYHFSSRRGWLNDPNGLVWKDGSWHLFYQHNPYNHGWDNMHWGHAISPDLFHWKEGPDALMPDPEGYMYSGSGFVVPKSKTSLPIKGSEALVLAYTSEGTHSYVPGLKATQSLAWSDDGGKTFQKYKGNPVLPHQVGGNRDPKVFWHEPSNHWVMPLYLDGDEYGLYTSKDLVKWDEASRYRIPTDAECPDFFELPVEGNAKESRWVAWGAQGKYMLGSFDGKDFKVESGPHQHYFGAAYAGQSYDNAPDKRRVHIGWMRDTGAGINGAPFNLQMTLPIDFTLRRIDGKLRLWSEPSAEVTKLRADTKEWKDFTISPGDADPLSDFKGGQFEIEAVIDAKSESSEMGFVIFGEAPAIWKKSDQNFSGAAGALQPMDGKLNVRIFVDTVSMEVFVNGTYVSRYIRQTPGIKPARIATGGGAVHFDSLKIHALKSVWK
ncbi:glycoside hydrolase family 32 protein [Luteolibacter luteus]|uniref:Glycoside hydrolase family 32 protein n=1 Tax=Luteolibacter luteus TaxID=2728835 RepID=A0A858RDW2_9BACT|nr:glycoside hydrolase family 32 protein [Luteolibacter luteus]QJE94510.1 glycoside hydrolase family 32 protein [Luteolibacter luteus]